MEKKGRSVTAEAVAIQQALAEPRNSPAKEHRKQTARQHSISNLAAKLAQAAGLGLDTVPSPLAKPGGDQIR